jgi:hypothetical protein
MLVRTTFSSLDNVWCSAGHSALLANSGDRRKCLSKRRYFNGSSVKSNENNIHIKFQGAASLGKGASFQEALHLHPPAPLMPVTSWQVSWPRPFEGKKGCTFTARRSASQPVIYSPFVSPTLVIAKLPDILFCGVALQREERVVNRSHVKNHRSDGLSSRHYCETHL